MLLTVGRLLPKRDRLHVHWQTLVPLLLGLLLLTGCKRQNAYAPPPAPQVVVTKPVRQLVTPYLYATGNTVAFNQVNLVARVSGFLQQIRYKDGTVAHRGETLFVIEPEPYKAKLQQAQATLQSAEAQAVQTDAEYKRQASLGRTDFASRSAVDQAKALRDSNRANVLNQQAAVTLAAINVGYTQVTAPFDGVVTAHLVDVGSLVGASGPTKLASIVQLNPIYVTFNISEQEVLRVRAAMRRLGVSTQSLDKIPVQVELMTETGYPHVGKLDYVSPGVDPQTGTLMARAEFSNPNFALLPGFFVRIRIPLEMQRKEALLVPDTALGADQSGRYLLVVDKANVVQQRTVTTGPLVGTLRVIESGLQPDDRVIISGLQRAVPGETVAPKQGEIAAALPAPRKS